MVITAIRYKKAVGENFKTWKFSRGQHHLSQCVAVCADQDIIDDIKTTLKFILLEKS